MTGSDVSGELITFVSTELLSSRKELELAPDDDLLSSGLVDSLGVTRLIRFIERRFEVTVPPADVTIENFMTVERIASYLKTLGIQHGSPSAD